MPLFEVVHRTRYHYARPVRFGQHRAMLRPRDSHDLRLHDTRIILQPRAHVHWVHDVFSNSVALIDFLDESDELMVESRLTMERFDGGGAEPPRGEIISTYPFAYPEETLIDLAGTQRRHYPDDAVEAWTRQFINKTTDSADLLTAIMNSIKDSFRYHTRYGHGTQTPSETLTLKSGTCRDFALFMMEAARALGFAARFVSGYLYDPAIDGQSAGVRGAGATHAWVQIFLPLSGWVEFDPTNGIVGGQNLIRVGVARDPAQAVPLAGTYFGASKDFLGMDVEVTVRALGKPSFEEAG